MMKLLNHYVLCYLKNKNMSFLIKDNKVWNKYDKIWEVIKDKLGVNINI